MPTPLEILQQHDLRRTLCRTAILTAFQEASAALSHQQIEEILGKDFDRVTIYRTLGTFEEKGILHKVPDMSGQAKYALCETDCSEHDHKDNHVHFKCKVCKNVYCLSEVELPILQLPKGYEILEAEFLLTGKCENCS